MEKNDAILAFPVLGRAGRLAIYLLLMHPAWRAGRGNCDGPGDAPEQTVPRAQGLSAYIAVTAAYRAFELTDGA